MFHLKSATKAINTDAVVVHTLDIHLFNQDNESPLKIYESFLELIFSIYEYVLILLYIMNHLLF